jgi:hypothetical protein
MSWEYVAGGGSLGDGFVVEVAAGDWPGAEWAVLSGMRGELMPPRGESWPDFLKPSGFEKSRVVVVAC